jgi:hypothetical protein
MYSIRLFPNFVGGFVGEHEAGQRLFQAAHDPRCAKSGVYWSWNGGPREGRGSEALEKEGQISGSGGAGGGWDSIFENDQSSKVLNIDSAMSLFDYSTEITGAKWPSQLQTTSPCPTLKVIGAVTSGMVKREEMKRMREMGRPGIDDVVSEAERPKITVTKKAVLVADRVVAGTLSNTVGRVARFAGRRILGRVPDTALSGSYHDINPQPVTIAESKDITDLPEESTELIDQAISEQLKKEAPEKAQLDSEDEALFRGLYEDEREKKIADESRVAM